VRCGSCKHEFLLAFSCKCRYFCPTCHAKRVALWGIWLEETLLAEVPHRQVVLAVPKRLRPYFLYHRTLLGDLSHVAARTVTAFIRATLGERDLSVGIVSSIQTHGSLANWHPHLHMLVTDGGFRSDGTFVRLPLHDVATLTEAFRRAVLQLFVKRELMDVETAQSMLAWPHSGFHAHDGVWAAADDKEFTVRLARYCARNPIALGRMQYDEQQSAVTYHSDKPTGPPTELVVQGPYIWTRNPMLTGVFTGLFGLGVLLHSVGMVLISIPAYILLHVIELKLVEEPELERRFGTDYSDYRRRVPMFWPRFWRGMKRRAG
jgi:hypothetical protein